MLSFSLRVLWKSFHLCFSSNLTKNSSTPSQDTSGDPNRPSDSCLRLPGDLLTSSTFTTPNSSSSSDESNDHFPPPDLTDVLASRRFFFSVTDSPDLRYRDNYDTSRVCPMFLDVLNKNNNDVLGDRLSCLPFGPTLDPANATTRFLNRDTAIKQHVQSSDPYNDFRRSMQEMLDAVTNPEDLLHYEFLHELLLSYLSLNAADTHKFILRAFAGILLSLLSDGHIVY